MNYGLLNSTGISTGTIAWAPQVITGPSDTTLLAGETDGLAIDFTDTTNFPLSTWAQLWNQVRTSSVDVYSSPHVFYTQSGTSPKVVKTSSTGLGWSPHNTTLQSQTLDNAAWTATAITVTANDTTGPDGTATAEKAVESNTSTSKLAEASSVAVTSGFTYTVSVYVKASNITWFAMAFGDDATPTNGITQYFDLGTPTTGTTTTAGSGWTVVSKSVTSIGSGWLRCTLTVTTGAATSFMTFRSATADNSTTRVTTGTYWLWGAQRNRGIAATAYIATTSAAVYGLPISYGEGLLVEPAATNLVTNSQGSMAASWGPHGSGTITDNNATAPDGSTTAALFTCAGGVDQYEGFGQSIGGSGTTQYTISTYFKAGTAAYVLISMSDDTANAWGVWFNASTGAAGSSEQVGNGTVTSSSSVSIGNGWYRASVTGQYGSNHNALVEILITSADGNGNSTNGQTAYIWGIQLEASPVVTSYVPTVGSTATRATDKPNVAISAFPWTDATGTAIAWIKPALSNNAAAGRLLDFSDGATGNEVVTLDFVTSDTPDSFGLGITDGGSVVVTDTVTKTGSASTNGNKVAAAWQANSAGIVVDASAEVTDASCTMPTPTSLSLGYSQVTASRELNGFIKRLTYVPRRMTTGQMQTKTS